MMHKSRIATTLALSIGLLAIAVALSHRSPSDDSSIVAAATQRVPAAQKVFEFRGAGFERRADQGYHSEVTPLPKQSAARTIAVIAPARSNGPFQVRDGRGEKRASVRLVGASEGAAHIEQGLMVYPSAYPSVDVVGARDPERFELAYIAHTANLPPLELEVQGGSDSRLALEDGTGAAILRGASGPPKLRVERPVAFDAAGNTRTGSYVVADARTLRLALDTEGLVPPIVIDPAFHIPFWTLTDDGRAPGGVAYDVKRQSRETQIVLNAATGKPWLIRPSASLRPFQYDDALGVVDPADAYSPVSPTPRVSGRNGPPPNPLLSVDLIRTVYRETETYEWNDDGWRLLPHTGLNGFIDPSLAFDSVRGRMVAVAGRLPGQTVETALINASAVFENDGRGWVAKGPPGGPPPRERAASVGYGSKIVLFGGRSLDEPADLLNDTWTYDGNEWRKVPVSNPPPACESSQLIHDTRRDRVLLIGGSCNFGALAFNPSDVDGFRLWEFDGSDWLRRFDIDDPSLPRSFRLRRGVAAAWNPVRRTTTLFGGFVDVTEQCPLTPAEVADQRFRANLDIHNTNDFTLKQKLEKQGCWGGYVQDTWEWDGATLRALTQTSFGSYTTERWAYLPIFQQVSSQVPPPTAGVDDRSPASNTKLWPWRYDSKGEHFAQRSALERAASQPGRPNAPATVEGGQAAALAEPAASTQLISPLFAPRARPQLVVAPVTGKLLIFMSDDGRVFETDLATWADRTPATSPFASGQNDFFAATWDSGRQLAIVFDPRSGATWEHGESMGWRRVQTPSAPGIWGEPLGFKTLREFDENPYNLAFVRMPRMTYDRARSRTVMHYRDSLWEYDGATWTQQALPAGLRACKASTLLAFDDLRNRTVVVGCSVPAQTWEWDGVSWFGPFASPFQAKVARVRSFGLSFRGTLELTFLHPNALFESGTLGGVGIVDGDGTLRVWNGAAWDGNTYLGDPVKTDAWKNYHQNATSVDANLPAAYYPPLVEDFSANRVLAFRDGIQALRELPLSGPPAERQWQDAFVGERDLIDGNIFAPPIATVHPFPMELLPLHSILPQASADPSGQTNLNGEPKPPASFDDTFSNLFWPFRLLADPTTRRVRVLTHRGAFWELGSERVYDIGEPCLSSNDCKGEGVCSQGVCCTQACDGHCLTCNGANPGTCEAVPAGTLEATGRCGAGECAGVCSGVTQFSNGFPFSNCAFDSTRSCGASSSCVNGQLTRAGRCKATEPTCVSGTAVPAPCPGGMKCQDANSCKATCAAASDCAAPNQACSPDGSSCVPDGKLCRSDAECPRFNQCAADGKSCKPDAVLTAATARGVVPTTWQAPAVLSPQEVARALRDAGFREDAQGRIVFDAFEIGGLVSAFDPNLKTPLMGLRSCVYRLQTCALATGKMDECVAGAPRCEDDTPWLGDPGGTDCCPDACLTGYFDERELRSSYQAVRKIIEGSCYPGLTQYYQEQR